MKKNEENTATRATRRYIRIAVWFDMDTGAVRQRDNKAKQANEDSLNIANCSVLEEKNNFIFPRD